MNLAQFGSPLNGTPTTLIDASVVITTRNQDEVLNLALRSLAHQGGEQSVEIVVVDDGGGAQPIVSRYASCFARLRYVWQPTQGHLVARTRHLGMRLARGRVLIFLDGRLIPSAHFVGDHLAWHEHHSHSLLLGKIEEFVPGETDLVQGTPRGQEARRSATSWALPSVSNLSLDASDAWECLDDRLNRGVDFWDPLSKFGQMHPGRIHLSNDLAVAFKVTHDGEELDHDDLVEFARNSLFMLDQGVAGIPENVAAPLAHYRLEGDKWRWNEDTLRSTSSAAALLREWLAANGYSGERRDIYLQDPPELSVIIASYEQRDILGITLPVIDRATLPVRHELVICADGSGTEEFQAVTNLVRSLSTPAIYCWQPKIGFRVAASRNNGLDLSEGRIVVFLDGDVVPEPDLLAKHWAAHARWSTRDSAPHFVAGTRHIVSDTSLTASGAQDGRLIPLLEAQAKPWPSEENWRRGIVEMEGGQYHPWRLAISCNLSLSNPGIERFDEKIVSRFGGEDMDFAYRLTAAGATIEYDPSIVGIHFGPKSAAGFHVHVGASHEDLVIHAECCLYSVAKHRAEPYIGYFLLALCFYHLTDEDRWVFDEYSEQILFDAVAAYAAWRRRSDKEVSRILKDAGAFAGAGWVDQRPPTSVNVRHTAMRPSREDATT